MMIVVFRCSARNWLLFVVEPLAVLMVSHCACVCVCVCLCLCAEVHLWVYVFACMHVGLHVCVCVKRSGYFVPPQMCQCSVWSPARLFHVIVPPLSVRSLRPAWSRAPSAPSVPPTSSLSPPFFPSSSLSPYISLCSIVPLSSFAFFFPAFTRWLGINGGYQDVNYMGVFTCLSPLTANWVYFTANHFPKHKFLD